MADKLKIIKKSALDWFFIVNEIPSTLRTISDFECNIGDTFNIVELDGSRIFIKNLADITLFDETTNTLYPFTLDPIILTDRLRNLDFVPFRGQTTSNNIIIGSFCRDINITNPISSYILNPNEKINMLFIDQAPQYKSFWSQTGNILTLSSPLEVGSIITISGITLN